MKKKSVVFFILIGISTICYSQIIDTTTIALAKDTIKIDSIRILDSIKKNQFVNIQKSVLDSLLRPFYKITLDSIGRDTLKVNQIKPKYRLSFNSITKDTIYIPIPKPKEFVSVKNKLIIDTLQILDPIKLVKIDTTKYAEDPVWWNNRNGFGLDISEAAFVNWNAGGNNSISGVVKFSMIRSYKKLHVLWHNEIYARYGLNSQEDRGVRKTDDLLRVNSTFGYRKDTLSNWFYSVKLNFNTQFTNGFSYPDTDTPISRFFAPAYFFLGAGTQYDLKKEKFYLYISPITLKSTFVLDDALANSGAFGVVPNKRSRHQFGSLIQSSYTTEILNNVVFKNRISLYTDYLNQFGNIDINWDLGFDFIINKYIKANLGGYLIYDDDIKYKDDINGDGQLETLGARVQLKQLFGIGFTYNF